MLIKKSLVFLGLVLLSAFIGACNTPSASPTPDVNAAYTEVAQTFEARRTEEAARTPSATPSPTPTLTLTPTSTPSTPEPPTPTNTQPAPTNTTAPITADQCVYMSQNIPDNSVFQPGAPVGIIWTIKNTGETTWSSDYKIRFYAGEIMGGPVEKEIGKEVKAQENYDVSLALTAPAAEGSHNTIWVLTSSKENGEINFCSFNLIIEVKK